MKTAILLSLFALVIVFNVSQAQSDGDDVSSVDQDSVDAAGIEAEIEKHSSKQSKQTVDQSPSILGGAFQGAIGAARQRIATGIAQRLESLKARIRAARAKRLKSLEEDIVAMEHKLAEVKTNSRIGSLGLGGMQRLLKRWENKLDKRISGITGETKPDISSLESLDP